MLRAKAYLCIFVIQAAFSTFRFAYVGVERQTNTQTYKHTQFLENNFNKKCGHKCTIYTNGIYLIQSILIVVIIKVSCVGFLCCFFN